jgi:hypothetical protein
MKPEGNRVEIRIGRNVRPSGTIGYEEEAPAKSCGRLLPGDILRRKSGEVGALGRERKLGEPGILEKAKARQGSRRVEEIPRMATKMN